MVMDIIKKIKVLLEKFKSKFGDSLGKYLIQNSLISIIVIVLLYIILNVDVTLLGIFEWILAIPIISIIVAAIRMALKCLHTVIPHGGVIRLIIDVIVSLTIITAIGYFMPTTNSDIISSILLVIFDLIYVAIIIFLLKGNKIQ